MSEKKGSFKLRTKNGFDFFECSSALQKSIRRGLEEDSMFWAIELFEGGFGKYVWKRLIIMASEDIGMAEPNFMPKIMALKQGYDFLEKEAPKKLEKRLFFIQAVLELVHAKKSRYIDLAHSVYWKNHSKIASKKEIPDYALDVHTMKGKRKGRGVEHFYQVGALIENANKMPNEDIFEKLALKADIEEINNRGKESDIEEYNDNLPDAQKKMF